MHPVYVCELKGRAEREGGREKKSSRSLSPLSPRSLSPLSLSHPVRSTVADDLQEIARKEMRDMIERLLMEAELLSELPKLEIYGKTIDGIKEMLNFLLKNPETGIAFTTFIGKKLGFQRQAQPLSSFHAMQVDYFEMLMTKIRIKNEIIKSVSKFKCIHKVVNYKQMSIIVSIEFCPDNKNLNCNCM